jgi:hypothetical protein
LVGGTESFADNAAPSYQFQIAVHEEIYREKWGEG